MAGSPETLSLQIQSIPAGLNEGSQPAETALKAALEKFGRQLEVDNIYLYRMQQNGQVYTVILYGAFSQRAEALAALNGLPEEIRAGQPYLRTLAGVKKDIELSTK